MWFGTLMVIWKMAVKLRFFSVFAMLLRGGRNPEGNVEQHQISTPDSREERRTPDGRQPQFDLSRLPGAPGSAGRTDGAGVAAPAADARAAVRSLADTFDAQAHDAYAGRRGRDPMGNPGSSTVLRGRAALPAAGRRYGNVPAAEADAVDDFFTNRRRATPVVPTAPVTTTCLLYTSPSPRD